jgi:adenylate kinase family enzyme
MQQQTFMFFGRVGSGKGTQANLIIDDLKNKDPQTKCLYIETGEKLREFVGTESYSAKLTAGVLKEGGLMPSYIPIWAWTEALIQNFTGSEHIIFDGICRNPYESPVLDTALKFYKRNPVNVIVINTGEKWSIDRAISRGRGDDEIPEIKKRLEWYNDKVITAIQFFRDDPSYNVLDVNGEQTIEEVHAEIVKKLNW